MSTIAGHSEVFIVWQRYGIHVFPRLFIRKIAIMENWVNKGIKEEPFFYLKFSLLSEEEKRKYSEPIEYRVYLTLPDGQYTGEIITLVDKDFNIMAVRSTSSRFPLAFKYTNQYLDYNSNISELLYGLRKLYEVRCKAEPRPDYSNR